jgi:hypothetical protein
MAKATARKAPGIAGQGNRACYDAMFGKRLSSATSKHDTRPNRQRTRSAARSAAISGAGW